MNRELTKQLIAAEFPWKKGHTCGDSGYHSEKQLIPNHIPYTPTLSDLIKACGDRFGKLVKERTWYAYSMDRVYEFEGSTPEEAVAHLWLELNKK